MVTCFDQAVGIEQQDVPAAVGLLGRADGRVEVSDQFRQVPRTGRGDPEGSQDQRCLTDGVQPLARPRSAAGSTALLAVLLTACNGDGTSTAAPADGKTPAAKASSSGPGTASPTAGAKPAAKPAGAAGGGASPSTAPKPVASIPAPGKPLASATAADDGCDHKMPISPDEVAVHRYTPEGGFLSLIVKLGNWGCAPDDSDGAPFETVGKETYMPMDQAAYITVTNPIVAGTENQHIGVQEFLDWLEAHPDSGLVFKYHLGADGAIDRLDEEFTP